MKVSLGCGSYWNKYDVNKMPMYLNKSNFTTYHRFISIRSAGSESPYVNSREYFGPHISGNIVSLEMVISGMRDPVSNRSGIVSASVSVEAKRLKYSVSPVRFSFCPLGTDATS